MKTNGTKKWMRKGMALALLSLTPIASFAKGGGNGGGVWVCQNKDALNTIRKIELVDFYEAEKEFKLTLKKYPGMNAETIFDLYKYRIFELDKNLSANLEPYFSKLQERLNPVDSDLEVIDDALYRVRPAQKWCEGGVISYQQMANYTNYGSILINENLFNQPQFDAVEKAGLYLHEVVYEYLRDKSKDKDSQRARRIVGVVASTLTTEQAREALDLIRVSTNAYKMDFIKIAKGSFVMGSPSRESNRGSDENQVTVTISKDFSLMKTEVTQSQWVNVMGSNPSKFKNQQNCPESFAIINGVGLCPNNPVEMVSWNDVQAFIAKLNALEGRNVYRLPTEAEWEFAARAGTVTAYSFGSDDLNKYAWFYGNSNVNGNYQTHPVAGKLSNTNGLFDMHGNVWEWVQDMYQSNLPGGIDPVENAGSFRVFRGGSFDFNAQDLRSANRYGGGADYRYGYVGFRLAKDL
jgi:formylglycine-generating enzyme required for sulfatase activity